MVATKRKATIDDLFKIEEKAEIVCGEIKYLMATGGMPGYAGDAVYRFLFHYAEQTGIGNAVSDNKAFRVDLPNCGSFSPDAAYFIGAEPGMRFFDGAPIFAVEVRCENDYGAAAEREMAGKRADYFAAGTLVVWDVGLRGEEVVRKYTTQNSEMPTLFRRDEIADAEPAVPGWTIPVNSLFKPKKKQ